MAALKNHPGMWLRDDAAAAINALEDKYGVIVINSAGRTVEDQQKLIDAYDAGDPNVFIPARPPETSTHVMDGGIAVDVYNYTDDRGKLNEFGFEWYGNADKVHYTFRGRPGSGNNAATSWNRTGRSTADIQRLVGANPDGIHGPETDAKLRAWQVANRLDADGIFGVLCDAVGFPIDTDGDPGVRTFAKLQHRTGAKIDGELGADTWGRLQTALGVPSDGIPGPVTYEALQRAVGASPDGLIGPETWRKTQAFLNTGKPFPRVGVNPTSPATPTVKAPARPSDDTAVPGVWLGKWSDNREARTDKVRYFVVHHAADPRDPATQVQRFMSPNDRSVSPTWFVGADGIARKIVHPDDRQWTTGRIIDQQAVTVETQNVTGAPTWLISDESHEQIAQLVVWAAKRYGFPIDRQHVLGHSEARAALDPSIGATACPGPSMDLDRIVKRARELASPAPVPTPDTVPVKRSWLESVRDGINALLGRVA
ncbi:MULTISPECIES: peptidoglycan-binding protein [unclassified Microbacterium]|uniref:peptidoglycan-binding protein n=1 Tax=unclassified Microbacterium TaxID=2609290 RepID=UPI003016E9D7